MDYHHDDLEHLGSVEDIINRIKKNDPKLRLFVLDPLIGTQLQKEHYLPLSEALKNNTHIETADLGGQRLNDYPELTTSLLESLQSIVSLKCLDLSGTAISGENYSHIACIVKLISSADTYLQRFRTICQINILRLDNNDLGDKGIETIIYSNPSALVELSIRNVNVGEKGLLLLANWLTTAGATLLKILKLDNNSKIGPNGAKCLSSALIANKTLQTLSISNCNLGNEGIKVLSDAMGRNSKSAIEMINFHGNRGGDEGLQAVASLLASRECSLTSVGFENNDVSNEMAETFLETARSNRKLTYFNLNDNPKVKQNTLLTLSNILCDHKFQVTKNHKPPVNYKIIGGVLIGTAVIAIGYMWFTKKEAK